MLIAGYPGIGKRPCSRFQNMVSEPKADFVRGDFDRFVQLRLTPYCWKYSGKDTPDSRCSRTRPLFGGINFGMCWRRMAP